MPRLKLMGRISLERESGSPVRLTSRRHPLALLGLLAAAPSRTMSRGKLVGLLWPEVSESRARHRLSTCLYNVRQELGDEVVLSTGEELRLDPERLPSDVVAFEWAVESGDHQAAVELYGGPFMEGFHIEGAAELERVVEGTRARLERDYWSALESLARVAGERGDPDTAAEWWRRRAHEDLWDTSVAVRWVEALTAAGNPAAALRVADEHERRLRDELGVEPGEDLRAAVARVKKGRRAEPPSAPQGAEDGVRGEDRFRRDTGGSSDWFRARGVRAALVTIALLVGVAGGWYLLGEAEAEGPGADSSLAVLPFETLGEEADPIAAGLHVDLLARLSNIAGLKVVSGTTVGRFQESALALPAIADSLGATWVVEGSVQRADDRIRVNAQLVDPRTDTHLWAATYDRKLTAGSLFALQGEIATEIAGALEARLTPAEARRVAGAPTGDLDAYRLYAEARRRMDSREESDLREAVEGFRRAIERDPTYAVAWAGLADALDLLEYKGFDPPEDAPSPETAARKALELDPDLAEAHATLGNLALAGRDGPMAIRHLQRAVRLRPSYGQAHHWLGLAWLVLGRPDAALEHLGLAVELDPTLVPARRSLAWARLARGEFRMALEEIRGAQGLLEEGSFEHRKTRRDETILLYHVGNYPEIRRMVREESADWPGGGPNLGAGLLTMIDARTGDPDSARDRLDRLEREGAPHLFRAWIHAALGEKDRALEDLSHPIEREGDTITILFRYALPEELAEVRADPRYRRLLGRLNANWGLEPDGSHPVSF